MSLKPKTWFLIAAGLSALNLVALGYAIQPGEPPWHGALHAALAVAFGAWAQRLRQANPPSELQPSIETLELEVGKLRDELAEVQERLDFTERVMAQVQEQRRVGPDH